VIYLTEEKGISELPQKRITISDEAIPFVARGGRIFHRLVVRSDPGIEDGEHVLVVDRRDNPLGTVRVFAAQ